MKAPAKKPGSQKREPLSREAIVQAAFNVIAEEGLAGFSTRRVAAALGCEAMSIYHYFPSKSHLVDALVDEAVSGMSSPSESATPREALFQIAHEFRKMGTRHPAFFPLLAVHRLNTRRSLAWLDWTTAIFRKAGSDDRTAAYCFRAMGYYVMGATLDETAGYSRGPSTAEPVPEEEYSRNYPNAAAVGKSFGKDNWDAIFDLGLEIMVDGVLSRLRTARDMP